MPAALATSSPRSTGCSSRGASRTTAPTACRCRARATSSTLATGVSAHAELFELAAAERAELLLVHHGLFWGSGPGRDRRAAQAPPAAPVRRRHRARRLPPAARRAPRARQQRAARARARRRGRSTPFALHRGRADRLPRDASRRRDCTRTELFARVARDHRARAARVRRRPGARARVWRSSRARAPTTSPRRSRAGADALLTGESAERAMAQAREAGVHLIAAGHYATETFGVRRLGEHLAERFGAAPRVPRRAQPACRASRERAASQSRARQRL